MENDLYGNPMGVLIKAFVRSSNYLVRNLPRDIFVSMAASGSDADTSTATVETHIKTQRDRRRKGRNAKLALGWKYAKANLCMHENRSLSTRDK